MIAKIPDSEANLSADIASFTRDPLHFVRYAYPWGEPGELSHTTGPRDWQAEILTAIGDALREGHATQRAPIRIAVASGHGVGKSALVAWIVDWALATHEQARVIVTANTGGQLQTKTWPEIAKWFNLLICRHWFELSRNSLRVPAHKETWRADQVTWSAENTEAFAGLHNAGKRLVVIFDEASTIDDKVWEVTEGALSDEGTEILWIVFGNPTRNSGRFRECFGRYGHLWTARQIDSRTVPGTNKAQIAQWIETYGEDSDFVRVRVRGVFPRSGSLQFIASDLVGAAMRREVLQNVYAPVVIGVDVARFGDDKSVIYVRRGLDGRTFAPLKFRGLDNMALAGKVAEVWRRTGADALFVDAGGGAGVIDRLRQLNVPVAEIAFGGRADRLKFNDETTPAANKRAEMWAAVRAWLKAGGALPDDPELEAELTQVEYGFNARDELQLERKEDMKARGLSSPDIADALALTFAYEVAPRNERAARGGGGLVEHEYDVLGEG
jgi:hypothetical protein